jgi:hypothetical protein
MKTITCGVLLLTSISIGSSRASPDQPYSGPWGPVSNHVQMSIELDTAAATNKPAFVLPMEEPRSPQEAITNEAVVILRGRLRNLSTNLTLFFFEAGEIEQSPAASFEVTLPSGKEVAIRPKAPNGLSHGGLFQLVPGQVLELDFHLNRFCSFNEVGIYRITGKWRLGLRGRAGVAAEPTSNPLEIRVTRSPWMAQKIGGATH